jgi:urease accessory protein UreF
MLGIRPARLEILAIAAVFAAAGIAVHRFRRVKPEPKSRSEPTPSWWIIICCVAIGYGFMAVAIDALLYPVIEWDAFAIWQLKAKVLAIYPLYPQPGYFTNLSLSYSHLRYPLLVPMISAAMHAMTGRLDDLGKTVALLFYPGMELAVFAAVRRINGNTAALTATALLAGVEPLCRYGGSGTAEMAITAFYACSLLCILRWRENRDRGFLVLAAIFSAWMAWTKNEGLALAAINAIVVAASGSRARRRNSLLAGAIFVGIVAAIYLPWILYSWGLPRTDEDYAGRLASPQIFSNLGRLGTILTGFGQELIDWEHWGLFWIIAAGLALAEWRRFKNPQIAAIGILLALHLVAYMPAFLITNWNLEELMSVTLDRLLMHAAPAGAILIGALWPAWVGGTAGSKTGISLSGHRP